MDNRSPCQIVVDTNVLVAGLRSNQGASYQLLMRLNDPRWQMNLSVGLVLEYEAVLKREQPKLFLTLEDIDGLIDDICCFANHQIIFYQWRPIAHDPNDDFVIDLAVRSQANFIITYNLRDIQPAEQFGIQVVTPKTFLQIMGEL